MANTADVMVRFLADTAQVETATKSMGGTLKGFAKSATSFFGGVAIGAFAKDAIGAASDLNESMNKVNVVFGKSAGAVRKFTEDAAHDFGLSTQAALDAAGAYGNMFVQLGFTTDAAQSMSKGMLTLTADLASFHNADPTEVLAAQQAAFRGEYDAVQKFIPTINAAAVEQRALADTHKASAKELTAADKAAAAYALMIEGAGKATGDWARTADEGANKQRTMNAEMQNAEASIGQALQPALEVVVPWIAKAAEAFAGASPEIQKAAVALAAFAVAAYLISGPIGLIVLAVGAVGTAAFLLWTHWDEVWGWIKDHPAYAIIIGILAAPIAAFVLIIGGLHWLADNWSAIWDTIKDAVNTAVTTIRGWFDGLIGFFKSIPGAIANALSTVFNVITAPFRTAVDEVKKIIGEIGGAFESAIGFVKRIWNGFARAWNGITIKIPSVDIPLVGEIGGGSVGLPDLPILARGGVVTRATLALIGERGPEAVVPLDRAGFGTSTYYITVNVAPGANPIDVGAATVDAIRNYERANGAQWRAS